MATSLGWSAAIGVLVAISLCCLAASRATWPVWLPTAGIGVALGIAMLRVSALVLLATAGVSIVAAIVVALASRRRTDPMGPHRAVGGVLAAAMILCRADSSDAAAHGDLAMRMPAIGLAPVLAAATTAYVAYSIVLLLRAGGTGDGHVRGRRRTVLACGEAAAMCAAMTAMMLT